MSKKIPITVITVVRNGEAFIDDCISSVVSQNIKNLEYILIDGASTDQTMDKVKRWGDAITMVISEPDKGLYDAMNKGLHLANGRYIHFLNSDDAYLYPDTLQRLLPKLDENMINYGALIYKERNGMLRRLGAPFSLALELKESHIPQPTLFVSKKVYQEIGDFNLNYPITADYDMVLRLVKRFPVRFVDQPITLMRAGGLSDIHMKKTFKEAYKVSVSHGRNNCLAYLTYMKRLTLGKISRKIPFFIIDFLRLLRRGL